MNNMQSRLAVVFYIILVVIFVLFLIGLVVSSLWLGWLGGWYGVSAVVFAHYMGAVSRVLKDTK